MFGVVKRLARSCKFWLCVSACIAAAATGQPHLIPAIILAEIGAITIEDSAAKIKMGKAH